MKIILPAKVYYIESTQDHTVRIGMDVRIREDLITWFDTIKERVMHIREILDKNPDHFSFLRKDGPEGAVYTFVPMTLEIYNEKVKPHLLAGKEFSTLEDMQKAFEETKIDAW